MKLTRRALLALVPATALAGCAMPGQDDDEDPSLADGPLTLLHLERDASGAPIGLVHLRLDPAKDGDNDLAIWLTDLQGTATSATVAVRALSLADATTIEAIALQARNPGVGGQADLAPAGWWQFDVKVEREGSPTTTPFLALLPDPNIHGTDAAPSPEESPDARALFDRAIVTMQAAPHLRWRESINTGDDTMVAIDITQVAATATSPQGVEQHMRYSGTFAARGDGKPLPAPQVDSRHSITIGDEGWLLTADGTIATTPPTTFAPITEWGSIYAAAEGIALGPAVADQREAMQVISFYSPAVNGQAQAWFVWWVGTKSGRVHRIGMIARAHYMVWNYVDFDAAVAIDRPDAGPASPPASPASR